ncbi:MAG: ATP-binding protein [Candidatus Acidiferrales bacterium]
MSSHKVPLIANKGIFRGLASQNMLFHQCVSELVDNAIAACPTNKKFKIDLIFLTSPGDNDHADLYIADNGGGMSLVHLGKALQLGESATTESRLNEHGFGLKNALATLSGGNGPWKIWTRGAGGPVLTVEGPFTSEMVIRDDEDFPTDAFLPADFSTLIKVNVKTSFIQTAQGRGAPATDLNALRDWIVEHLGVLYRGYLGQDEETFETRGVIVVSIGTNSVQVLPVEIPFGNREVKYFDVEIGGKVQHIQYRYGTLDEEKRDKLIKGKKAKFYYQQNQPTQGIDIRLGKRVIATRQFETIWNISRHNSFNDFVGELLIPDLPRGVLSTTNTKTDFNLDDPDWGKIFGKLKDFPPVKEIRQKTETEVRDKWIRMLNATNPEDTVTNERSVWPTGTRIDVYRKTPQQKVIIYELKVTSGSPIHLYQLKMYWDGLVIDTKEQPSEAILLVDSFEPALEQMANMMNQLTPPNNTKPYNFKIERLKDKNL